MTNTGMSRDVMQPGTADVQGGKAERGGVTGSADTLELAKSIVEAAADKQASNVILLDTRKVCSFADYFVVCTCESERQMDAVREAMIEVVKSAGIAPLHSEGDSSSGWMLLDLGAIVAHVFAPFEREYYGLEKLWDAAPVVVNIV